MSEQRKAVIKNADMSEEMQQDAVDIASQALAKYNIEKVRSLVSSPWTARGNRGWNAMGSGLRCTVGSRLNSRRRKGVVCNTLWIATKSILSPCISNHTGRCSLHQEGVRQKAQSYLVNSFVVAALWLLHPIQLDLFSFLTLSFAILSRQACDCRTQLWKLRHPRDEALHLFLASFIRWVGSSLTFVHNTNRSSFSLTSSIASDKWQSFFLSQDRHWLGFHIYVGRCLRRGGRCKNATIENWMWQYTYSSE